MKNLYEILGLSPEATTTEVKKAFQTLALTEHPDKGGSTERMSLINEAYETLSDPHKRRDFDEEWRAFQEEDNDQPNEIIAYELIKAGDMKPYSHQFRKEHNSLTTQYKQNPLIPQEAKPLEVFQSDMYSFTANEGAQSEKIHDVFTLIRKKSEHGHEVPFVKTIEAITPALIVKQFIKFLGGDYFGTQLTVFRHYLAEEIIKTRQLNQSAPELQLYEGIFELILIAEQEPTTPNTLIYSVNKITNFAKIAPPEVLENLLPLFYNPFFRNLYAQAFHLYWQEQLGGDLLKHFEGLQEAKELLVVLKERLTNGDKSPHLKQLIRYVKLLYQFEKETHQLSKQKQTAEAYREEAFQSLDWVPVLIDQSSREILVNTFIQIGLKFQLASRLEEDHALQMADEQLSLKMYLTAAGISHHVTPDIELYANTHILHYLSSFKFQVETLNEIILLLKKRTVLITDFFPIFESQQSNISFLRQENKSLHLMRHLLQTLVQAYEYNRTHPETKITHHAPTTILYQAYEACLKNWYQEEYNPALEKQFRLNLMEELLFENDWTFLDVEQRVDSPFIMVDRDKDGWIKPTRALPFAESGIQYKTINGAEINHKTGKIDFFMTPWTAERPIYEKVFTLFDLEELLEKNIESAIFSLDPVDPLKPYHPFNAMRFAPSSLAESELLNTMLLTDYVLKFMTINQEVQGQYPFQQRPVAQMLSHVPKYLRQIVEAFQESQHTGALHRFWIETDEMNLSLSDESIEPKDIIRVRLGNLKMVVKKHRMAPDANGELKDIGDEEEGWPIYVLTPAQWQELQEEKRRINSHAMIFIYNQTRLIYWENHQVVREHVPQDYRETLIELYINSRGADGKLPQDTETMSLLYRITKDMAAQTGLSHRYSPEFIFAHEFTEHYDEFAQYLPEFGRLKELSKITVLIRYLNSIRKPNREQLEALDFLMKDSSASPPDTPSYKEWNQIHEDQCKKVTDLFDELRPKLSSSVQVRQWEQELNNIRGKIKSLSKAQQTKQLEVLFYSKLRNIVTNEQYNKLIDAFIYYNPRPLAEALRTYSLKDTAQDIRMNYMESKIQDIEQALDENGQAAAQRVAVAKSRSLLNEYKATKIPLEDGFKKIKLGVQEKEVDLKGQCFWVPASVRHEVRKDEMTGQTRYSFFTYGGVNIQPRVNVINGVNGPLKGNSVGGGAFNRREITRGFQDHHMIHQASKGHKLLAAAGFNIHSRANMIFLPTQPSQHESRSIHTGGHTKAARESVEKEMTMIYERGRAQNWSPVQYRSGLRTMLSDLRQEFKAGNIALNCKHRPWAK